MYVLLKGSECVWKIQHKGACQEINTAQGKAECCIYLETCPECCIFRTHEYRWCIVLLGAT